MYHSQKHENKTTRVHKTRKESLLQFCEFVVFKMRYSFWVYFLIFRIFYFLYSIFGPTDSTQQVVPNVNFDFELRSQWAKKKFTWWQYYDVIIHQSSLFTQYSTVQKCDVLDWSGLADPEVVGPLNVNNLLFIGVCNWCMWCRKVWLTCHHRWEDGLSVRSVVRCPLVEVIYRLMDVKMEFIYAEYALLKYSHIHVPCLGYDRCF